jgi:hypothetical protein
LAGATIDHLVSATIFLAAILLFISLFNQTIQTAVIYQQHRALATKCSDLLDNMILNPGIPADGTTPTVFGLQDINSMQYTLDPFSLMRLNSSAGTPVFYGKTNGWYSNMTVGLGNFLFMPSSMVVNYSSASKMLGINNTYGFQLALTPVVTFNITEVQLSPLRLSIDVSGVGFPLANATVNYRLIPISLNGTYPSYLTIQDQTGTVYTDATGFVSVPFQNFTINANLTYAFVAYAHLSGLSGMGFYEHAPSGSQQVLPFVDNLLTRKVILAHSYDVPSTAVFSDTLGYNATFVSLNEGYEFQVMQMANSYGNVTSGPGHDFGNVTIPNSTPGILVIAYRNGTTGGVVMMPWGLGSLAFPVTFGGNPAGQDWVTTDVRQVLVNGVAYQVKLSLWSYKGTQVMG